MRFQTPLVPATLNRRYKRFLADCTLEDGRQITAHCANPGSMMGLANPGTRVWLEPNDDPKKKLKYGWRLVEQDGGHFIGVDTAVPNRLLRPVLQDRGLEPFAAYSEVRAEVAYGQSSRIDFLLQGVGLPDAFVEVKSVTLSRQPGLAEFPDSVTARGAKHLAELAKMSQAGARAIMLYIVQRTDCVRMTLARDLDPKYGLSMDSARAAGVEVLAFACHITPETIALGDPVSVDF
jgi:sugar fermentation stimulation protein A